MNKRGLTILMIVVLFVAAALFLTLSGGREAKQSSQPEPSALATAAKAPVMRNLKSDTAAVGLYEKFELSLELAADYDNPYDPAQIDLSMELTSPSGKPWEVNGFYDGMGFNWKVRFSPDETGEWSYRLRAVDRGGEAASSEGTFEAVPPTNHGWIQVSRANKRFLEYRDGSSFYGVGVAYPWGITDSNLDKIAASGGNLVTYWNGNYDNAGNGGGKNQLESITFGIGKIDPLKAQRIDDLLESFEQRGLHMNFVIWPHDSLADRLEGWPATWNKNPFSALGEAKDFYTSEKMWTYQENMYRYIIARWGFSRGIGIWDLICEINGTDGWAFGDTKETDAWLDKVNRYFKENDPYGHPTMGSMAGNRQDYWDFAYRTLDLADRENYYSINYDSFAEDIRKRWDSYEKPLMIGETGNMNDVTQYHNAIWVSLANGLASSPIWWDFGQVSDDMFVQMNHFASFVAGIDFREAREPMNGSTVKADDAKAWAMRGEKQSYGWLIAETGGAGEKAVALPDWPDGSYNVSWYDPWTGTPLGEGSTKAAGGTLTLTSPASAQPDLAFTVRPR